MVTGLFWQLRWDISLFRAHRVGWRQYPFTITTYKNLCPCSEPTMWDGDTVMGGNSWPSAIASVLSPPCGMETFINKFLYFLCLVFQAHWVGWWQVSSDSFVEIFHCSEPTVWDGDKSMKPFEVMKRYFSCSKPTGWDEDSIYPSTHLLPRNCSKPTAWDGDLYISIAAFKASSNVFQAHRVGWRLSYFN